MAGVAGDVNLAVGEDRVVVIYHLDHLARGFLFRLGIVGKIALYVTERALLAERGAEGAHHGSDFLVLQNLQILVWLRRSARTFLRRILGVQRGPCEQQYGG